MSLPSKFALCIFLALLSVQYSLGTTSPRAVAQTLVALHNTANKTAAVAVRQVATNGFG